MVSWVYLGSGGRDRGRMRTRTPTGPVMSAESSLRLGNPRPKTRLNAAKAGATSKADMQVAMRPEEAGFDAINRG
jgi:hypothetical protein